MSNVSLRGGRTLTCHPPGNGGPEGQVPETNLPGNAQQGGDSGAHRALGPERVSCSSSSVLRPERAHPGDPVHCTHGPRVPTVFHVPVLGLNSLITYPGGNFNLERKSKRDMAQCGIVFAALSCVCLMAGSVSVSSVTTSGFPERDIYRCRWPLAR